MPDDYEMYEYEYDTNNRTQLQARSRVPTSPGERNDEIDALCEENPKECAKKHLNLMGFRNKLIHMKKKIVKSHDGSHLMIFLSVVYLAYDFH